MRISVCVGEYATTPYCIAGLELQVYCMEELCYCMRENAFLLDMTLLEEGLVDWIGEQCGLKELASELYPMVRKQGSLSAFVTLIMEYVGLYDSESIREVTKALKEGSGLTTIEKRKNQVDYLVRKRKYPAAIRRYDKLLKMWEEEEGRGESGPGGRVKASILHNKAVALTGLMEYNQAAECFLEAYRAEPDEEQYLAYLSAKRAELSAEEYLSFVAEQPEHYELSLRLEKKIESLTESFPETETGQRLANLAEWRDSDKQRYYNEMGRITDAMKESYRNSVSE